MPSWAMVGKVRAAGRSAAAGAWPVTHTCRNTDLGGWGRAPGFVRNVYADLKKKKKKYLVLIYNLPPLDFLHAGVAAEVGPSLGVTGVLSCLVLSCLTW